MAVLELLARQAPSGEFEDLLLRARRSGASEGALYRMERAVGLARGITSSSSRREQREAGLAALVDTARDLTFPYDVDGLMRVITRRARGLLNFDMAYVSLRAPGGVSHIRTSEGATTSLLSGMRLSDDRGIGGAAHAAGAPAWSADYLADDRFRHSDEVDEVVRAEGLRAIMAVPLRNGDSSVGALYGADRQVRHYTPDEIGLMCSLADLAAVAIVKAGLLDQTRAEVTELELDSSRARTSLTRMRHVSEAHSRIMNLVLSGGDLCNVAKAAGDALDGTVLIRDPGGRALASGGELPDLDEEAVAKASLDAHAGRRPVVTGQNTWVAPIIAGSEDLGVLVIRTTTGLTEEDERLLELSAQSVAFLLLMRRSTAVAEGPVRDELLDDLLGEPQHSPQQIMQRARRLGIDLSTPHVLVVARPEGGEQGRAVVWASSYAYRMSGLKTVHGGCVVLLLPGLDASAAARAV